MTYRARYKPDGSARQGVRHPLSCPELPLRALLIFALLAGTALVAGCQSSSTGSGVKRLSVYGQPCNTRVREAGLCRTVYR